jgi:hypothetical protein
MLGVGERLKGCAARTGKPASALDPLTRTQRLVDIRFARGLSATQGCLLYFARRVTFQPCADKVWGANPADLTELDVMRSCICIRAGGSGPRY